MASEKTAKEQEVRYRHLAIAFAEYDALIVKHGRRILDLEPTQLPSEIIEKRKEIRDRSHGIWLNTA